MRHEAVLGSKLARQIDVRDSIGHPPAAGIHVSHHAQGQTVARLQDRQRLRLAVRRRRQPKINHPGDVRREKLRVGAVQGDAVGESGRDA